MMKSFNLIFLVFSIILHVSCNSDIKENESVLSFKEAPKWSQEAIWYQVFVERFRNGDQSNDPTRDEILVSYPHKYPSDWKVTPWGQQWFKMSEWEKDFYDNDFYTAVQSRRYGGDLQGLIDKLDYLNELGINAIYINPLNYSASLHKYDAANYIHIDPTFGPDPKGDKKIIASEDVLDPSTWQFTSADKMFLDFIEKAHEYGIRVVLDYSWNHTGVDHPMWKDILENQKDSKYAELYEIDSFDNPDTKENEFTYTGWAGVKNMPELKKVNVKNRVHGKPYKGNIHPIVKQHIFNVSQRWLDPYKNGDFSKGLDGYRLDVADQIGMNFWREYRKFVRSVNPQCYLIGEIWWDEYPDKLMDPRPYLKGDIFDAVMHYQWYKPARKFFANANGGMKVSEFVNSLDSIFSGYTDQTKFAMMNMAASHDVPRLSTSFYNKNKYKFIDRDNYKHFKADKETMNLVKLFLIHQYTFIGSPQIWQGDEMGMWGGDDPDNRKPLWWEDLDFESENINSKGEAIQANLVKADKKLTEFYKKLINLRKNNKALIYGKLKYELIDDENKILIYSRKLDNEIVYAAFNLSNSNFETSINVGANYTYVGVDDDILVKVYDKKFDINLRPYSSEIYKIVINK
jgi:cyclomaltodextrinase / maltogenic alpha-amylase / neopullulanase